MKIGLHDSEKETVRRKSFPNYALMKISAYHKSIGDEVEWWDMNSTYDKVYSSKVFDFTPENKNLPPNTIRGGTGYDIYSALPPEIENMFPDYSIYPECDYAIGYITRGCPNNCRWCIVPQKEGGIKAYREWQELVRADSKKLILMDNNILACDYGIKQLESLIDSGYSIDLNQGMDARLVTDKIASILARLSWIRYIRFSCDTIGQIKAIENTADMLLKYGVKPYRLFIYLLVTKDIDNAVFRVEQLKKLKGINIYAQAERNERLGIIPNKLQLEFAQRYIYSGKFRKETWQDYCRRLNIKNEEENVVGKIDFNALKRKTEQQEVNTPEEENSELSQAYQSVWGATNEKIEYIELNRLNMFHDEKGRQQPFKINHEKVEQIKLSAADVGIITPLIVRKTDSEYQIISGHHRAVAAKELNILNVPCVVRKISNDEAYKIVIESNIQRMRMLPSEYGGIFTRYMERRTDIELTAQEIADKFGISKKTMYRYINLSKLSFELQDYADNDLVNIDSVDLLCTFSEENQDTVCEFIDESKKKVTSALAKKMNELVNDYNGDKVPVDEFMALLDKPKKAYKNKVYNNVTEKYHVEYSEKELDDIVAELLDQYLKERSR